MLGEEGLEFGQEFFVVAVDVEGVEEGGGFGGGRVGELVEEPVEGFRGAVECDGHEE